jgi:hypothetical protein
MFIRDQGRSWNKKALTFVFCFFFSLFGANDQKLVAVFDLRCDGTVSSGSLAPISDKISDEIAKDSRFTTFDRKYLPFVLEPILKERLSPCTTDQCLAEIGKLIGANQIVAGSIRQANFKIIIQLDCIDMEKSRKVNSITKTMAVKKEDFISKKVPQLVKELMGNPLSQSSKQATAFTSEKPENKSFLSGPTLIGGISAVAVGAAAATYLLTKKKSVTASEEDLPLGSIPEHTK